MRWLYGFDLVNGLDDIGIGSVYQHDTLTMPVNHVAHCPRGHVKHFHGIYVKLDVSESFIMRIDSVRVVYSSLFLVYDPRVNPQATNSFATAAFRYHSNFTCITIRLNCYDISPRTKKIHLYRE